MEPEAIDTFGNSIRDIEEAIAHYRSKSRESGKFKNIDESFMLVVGELEKRRRGFLLMTKLYSQVGSANAIVDVFKTLLKTIITEMDMDRAMVVSPFPGNEELLPVSWLGYEDDEVARIEMKINKCLSDFNDLWKKPLVVNGKTYPSRFVQSLRELLGMTYFVWIPVISYGKILSVIVAGNIEKDQVFRLRLEDSDIEIFQGISGMLAVVLWNIYFKRVQLESEEKYRNLIESIKEWVWEVDTQGNYTFCSSQVKEILGFEPEEMIGKSVMDLSPKGSDVREVYTSFLMEKKSFSSFERPRFHRNGSIVWLEISGAPIFDSSGNVIAFRGISRDITERKKAEETLRLQHYTRTLIETSPDPIFIVNSTGYIMDLNEAAVNIIHAESDRRKVLGTMFSSYFLAREAVDSIVTRVFTEGHLRDVELFTGNDQENQRIFFCNASLFKNQEDRVAGAIIVLRDISILKAIQMEVEKERNYSRVLIEKAHDGLAVCIIKKNTLDMDFTVWNDKMLEISGYSREYVNENSLICSFFKEQNQRDKIFRRLKRFIQLRASIQDEWLIDTKDSRQVNISFSASVLFESEDDLHILAIVRDITREKDLQMQLLQAEKLSSIGQMVSGIAHEINNPLTGIMGFSQMLLMRNDFDNEAREAMTMIRDESQRAKKIVSDLLTFGRKHKPEKKVYSVNEIVSDALKMREGEIRRSNIRLIRLFEEKFALNVYANRYQLQQVVINLLNNAVDALKDVKREKEIKVRTILEKTKVKIEIEDNGYGIDESVQSRIFDPFFTTKGVGEGTGLGLSISYGIIKEHKGRITIKSRIGKNTVFSVELPQAKRKFSATDDSAPEEINEYGSIKPQKDKIQPIKDKKQGAVRSLSSDTKSFKGKKVLVIDDEVVILKLLSRFMEIKGILIDTASNGEKGLQLIKENPYDMILSDYAMPGINGKNIYEEVVRFDRSITKKLFFMTGDIKDETRIFFNENNIRYLLKPFNLNKVSELLEENL